MQEHTFDWHVNAQKEASKKTQVQMIYSKPFRKKKKKTERDFWMLNQKT